jgi:hypothetical protein
MGNLTDLARLLQEKTSVKNGEHVFEKYFLLFFSWKESLKMFSYIVCVGTVNGNANRIYHVKAKKSSQIFVMSRRMIVLKDLAVNQENTSLQFILWI